MMPGTRQATLGHSTPPRRWWARDDDRVVSTMLPSELASAACIAASLGTPYCGSSQASEATSTSPPPMPSSPARTPTRAPSARKMSSRVSMAVIVQAGLHPGFAIVGAHAPPHDPPMKRLLLTAAFALSALPWCATAQSDTVQLRQALSDAARGRPVSPHMASHPAYGWIEFASLRRSLDSLPGNQAQAFLARYEGQAVAESFRAEWLRALHKRQDWAGIRAAWSPSVTNTSLRCIELEARQRPGAADAAWDAQVQEIWRSSGDSLPDQCDGPFAALDARGALTPELRWERVELAAAEWNPDVMRAAASGLPAAERALAGDYAAFVQSPHERALDWPRTDRSRLVASHGLAQLGRNDPDAAEARLPRYAQALEFDEAARGRVLYQIALWTVASYLPDSERRLNLVPASAYDERLHEWRVREALARSDWRAALVAIGKMGSEQRSG